MLFDSGTRIVTWSASSIMFEWLGITFIALSLRWRHLLV